MRMDVIRNNIERNKRGEPPLYVPTYDDDLYGTKEWIINET